MLTDPAGSSRNLARSSAKRCLPAEGLFETGTYSMAIELQQSLQQGFLMHL